MSSSSGPKARANTWKVPASVRNLNTKAQFEWFMEEDERSSALMSTRYKTTSWDKTISELAILQEMYVTEDTIGRYLKDHPEFVDDDLPLPTTPADARQESESDSQYRTRMRNADERSRGCLQAQELARSTARAKQRAQDSVEAQVQERAQQRAKEALAGSRLGENWNKQSAQASLDAQARKQAQQAANEALAASMEGQMWGTELPPSGANESSAETQSGAITESAGSRDTEAAESTEKRKGRPWEV